jgi:hypothetical protein
MPRPLILLLSLLLLGAPALAQFGSAGYGNPVLRVSETPPFTRADIRIMDSLLGLTPEQRASLPRPTDEILWGSDIRNHGM